MRRVGALAFTWGCALVGLVSVSTVHAMGKKANEDSRFRDIKFDVSVPAEHRALLKSDLARLEAIASFEPQPETQSLLKLDELSSETLLGWLGERVQYMLGESYDLEKNVYVASRTHRFENPSEFPILERPTLETDPSGKLKIMATNIGLGVYFEGKQNGLLLGFRAGGWDDIEVVSPRSGVIQIGEGLFLPGTRLTDPKSAAKSLGRLGTLFHEARHSDGHGKSLGFMHAVCPKGSDWEGLAACDRNLNGPYTVGAHMVRLLASRCSDCTVEEKELLRLRYLDSFGRVILRTPGRPEQIEALESLIETCRMLERYNIKSCESMRKLEDELEELRRGKESIEWDDVPEGMTR